MSGNAYDRRQARRRPQNNVPGYTGPQTIRVPLRQCIRYPAAPDLFDLGELENWLDSLDAENARKRRLIWRLVGLGIALVAIWGYIIHTLIQRWQS